MRKFYSFLLATVALLCCTAADAYATTGGWSSVNTAAYDGKCGDNAYWTLNEGTLTIFGTSAMYNYAGNDANRAPWYSNKENINSVTIEEGVTSIGNFAFDDCYNLTSIEIPSSVTSIGNYAFYYCPSLTSIEIPSSVTSIGKSAFYNCISLTSIEIPSSVTSIGESAFEACYGLTSIEIPSSVTSIGESAFSFCTGLTGIEIPSSVTSIGESAFWGCTGLTSIVSRIAAENLFAPGNNAFYNVDKTNCTLYVPAGAKSTYTATEQWKDFTNIVEFNGKCGDNAYWVLNEGALTIFGEGAMYNYNSDDMPWYSNKEDISSVTIEEGVTSIGNYAFYDCIGLTSVEIPSSVTSIGNYAFGICTGLTSVEIPSSVTSIGYNAFMGCYRPTSIVVDEGNSVYDSRGNCNAIIETASNTLIAGCINTIIPEGVTSIGDYAFWGCNGLTSIEIPNSVTSIGEGVFAFCDDLTSIEIPNSVTSIGYNAFLDCYRLTSIEIPSSVTSIGNYAFGACTGLTSIISHIAAENLFVPGNGAFYKVDKTNCTLYVPAGAKSTYAATEQWKDFTNIVEPNGKCGDNAYWALNEETGALTIFGTGAIYNYNPGETPWYSDRENISSVTIEEGVTSIGNWVFYNCTSLTSIEIPSSVTSIGWDAFTYCTSLTSIEIPSTVTSIGYSAFHYCTGLTSIEIPSSVTSIGNDAFGYCSSLTSIVVDEGNTIYDSRGNCNAIIETASNTLIAGCKNTIIPEGVTSIGDYAFYGCSGLTSIEIPSSVTSIGNSAFNGCYGLTSIDIPSSVTSISHNAFNNCNSLTSIEIPSSVTSIGNNAFSNCTGLTSIVSHIAAENLFAPGENAFNGIDKDACTLYVPAGAKSTYAATEQWKDFTNIVETYDLTVTAAGYATLYLGTAVEIPAGVEAYTAGRIEGDLLKMQAVEDVIPANTAVIIKAEEGKYTFIPSNETPDAIEGNLLRGTLTDTYIKPGSAQTAYVLSKVDGIVGMHRAKLKADGTFKNNANRVYMLLGDINVGEGDLDTSNPGGQLSNGYRFDFSGTTAIEGIEAESAAPAVYYDLSGRRVQNPTKGIYIVNGRKVFIK